jgi:hypothetical protein
MPLGCTCYAIDQSLSNFNNINSVDELIDFIDNTRDLFEYDSNGLLVMRNKGTSLL